MRCSLSPNRPPVASSTCFAARTTVFSAAGPVSAPSTVSVTLAALDALGDKGVVQVEQGEDRLEAVVTVVLAGQHTEEQVDLRVRRDLDGGHRADWARMSRKAMGLTASDTRPSRVTGSRVVR